MILRTLRVLAQSPALCKGSLQHKHTGAPIRPLHPIWCPRLPCPRGRVCCLVLHAFVTCVGLGTARVMVLDSANATLSPCCTSETTHAACPQRPHGSVPHRYFFSFKLLHKWKNPACNLLGLFFIFPLSLTPQSHMRRRGLQ